MTLMKEPGRRDSRLGMWLGHYSTHLLTVVIALSVINYAAGRPGYLEWPLAAVWLIWVASLITGDWYHDRRLCERCLAAAPTLAPEAAVHRWHAALWCFHNRFALIVPIIFAAGWIFYTATLHREHPWMYTIDTLTLIIIGAVYLVSYQHRRLYPWCPYCRWDNGGDEEAVPDVPAPTASRS